MPRPADRPDGLARSGHAPAQATFAAALLDADRPVPDGVVDFNGRRDARRFAVYRNNVAVGLVDALAATFPAVRRLVGERYFRAMARVYIADHPPRSPLIFEYGTDFPDFIAGFAPARRLVYLPDVARLERLWLDAYHAADAAPLAATALAAVAPQDLPGIGLRPHPAARLHRSRYAALTIFSANRRGDDSLAGIDPLKAEDTLVTRPALQVETRHLPPGGAVFLARLMAGARLGAAAEEAATRAPGFDLPLAIAAMLEAGAFSAVVPSERPGGPA